MTETWTAEQLANYIRDQYGEKAPGVIAQVNWWLKRGDGVAVYVNRDLGHPDLGQPRLASYGSAAAMLETDDPPERLPDTPSMVNWRYWLEAVYRGDPMEQR